MAKENVMKFEERLMKDDEFQKRLEEAVKAYNGDQTDEKAVFDAVIVPLATEEGLTFTFEEFSEVRKAVSDGELDPKEMKAVAGGTTKCGRAALFWYSCGLYAELSGTKR